MLLFEGMWTNDLEDLIEPLISIDEFESKIDPSAMVVGFYVNERDAADDLNRFIQKSAVPILDSDVSPAPDQHGYYLVFVEISMNDRFSDNLRSLGEEVAQLGAIREWKFKIRGVEGIHEFDPELIHKALIKNQFMDRFKKLKATIEMLRSKILEKSHQK